MITPENEDSVMHEREGIYCPQDYRHMFKDKCASCSTTIPATWKHYYVFGNYCALCNAKASEPKKFKVRNLPIVLKSILK